MPWYGAHIVAFVKFPDSTLHEHYPIMENIVVIHASDDAAAWHEAERIGMQAYHNGPVAWDGRAGVWTFAGVRRLVSCDDVADLDRPQSLGQHLHSGTEVTYLQFEVQSEQDFHAYMRGEPVTLLFEE